MLRFVLQLVALVLLATACSAQSVLFLLADDLGPDKVGCYGAAGAPRTPSLDALAARGVRFERFITNPVCSPTRAAVLSGLYAHRHLIGRALSGRSRHGLDPRLPGLLPKCLPSGHLPVVLGKWHMSGADYGGPFHPLLCGFALHAGSSANFSELESYSSWNKTFAAPWTTATVQVGTYATTDTEMDAVAAVRYLRAMGRPYFLWVGWNAVHAPFHYPPGRAGQPSVTGLPESKAMVEALDESIGRVLAEVDWATTTVVFCGDNGSVSGTIDPASGLRHAGAKGTTYEGGVRAPLIIAGARVGWTGTSTALVSAVDLHPTMIDLASGVNPGGDGVSLAGHLASGVPHLRALAYSEWFNPNGTLSPTMVKESARDQRYALVRGEGIADEFYDLWLDPLQQAPLPMGALDQGAALAADCLTRFLDTTGF